MAEGRRRDRQAVTLIGRRATLFGATGSLLLRPAMAAARSVGWMSGFTPEEAVPFRDAVLEGLAKHGFSPGSTMRWIERYASNRFDRVEPLCQELLAERVDIVLTHGLAVLPTIKLVSPRVPVIFVFSGDPVAAGLADSLAHPRGNATGLTVMAVELNAKRIELLKEISPGVRHVAVFSNPNHPGEAAEIEVCRRTVAALGIDLLYLKVFDAAGVDAALERAGAVGADAFVALPDGVTVPNRQRIGAAATARRIPAVSGWSLFADSGWLMTYGPNLREAFGSLGGYVTRVLAGAAPASLPIEQPTKLELVINVRTAKTLGIELAQSMLDRADRLIE